MSLTQAQISTAAGQPPANSRWRAFRFPLIVLAVVGGLFAVPWIMAAFDADTDAVMPLSMFSQWIAPLLTVLLLGGWWLFFSPVSWPARLGGAAIVLLAGAGFCLCVREFEITKGRVGLVPRFHFVWDPTYDEPMSASPDELPGIYGYVGDKDFPRYRGAHSDGIVAWARLETDWDKTPPTVEWSHPCGNGYSGIAVAGNIVVTLEQRDAGESVVCYDRISGRQHWARLTANSPAGVFYKDSNNMGNGPRSTPTIHDDHIYTIGATGELACHTVEGKHVWGANILKDAQAKNIKWA